MQQSPHWPGLVFFLALCLGAGGVGAMATTPEVPGWYRTLEKPDWTPPDAVFGPVWSALYVMMGVAAWLAWQATGKKIATRSMGLFAFQLVLNVGWSCIFFGLHQPGWAFVEVLFLWLAILLTAVEFFRHSQLAGWLMIPYLLWVSYAAMLNYVIWQLNLP